MSGLVGFYNPKNCIPFLCEAGFHLQHRGDEAYGASILTDKGIETRKSKSKDETFFRFEEKINSEICKGEMGIWHASGGLPQPVEYEITKLGSVAVAFSGKITNLNELVKDAVEKNSSSFYNAAPVEVLTKMICRENNIDDGIKKMSEMIEGACNLAIITKDGLFAYRDSKGYQPYVLMEGDLGHMFASESCVSNCKTLYSMNIKSDIKPGELIFIDRQNPSKGFQTLFSNPSDRKRFCVFEWVYTANPTSEIERVVGEPVRKNLGACLARTDKLNPDFSADADIGVPDSGIAHALGYSEESGIPFRRFFVKEQYIGRSYIPLDPEQRKFVATRKQMVDKKGIAGLTIVINDDSIVRGTQYGICGEEVEKNLLTLLTGAKGVHVRISYPMILHPCPFGETTKTYQELAGFRHNGDVEKIRQEIQKHAPMPVTLRYNSVEDLVNSIHDSKNKINPKDLCTYCATGQF